jgi:ubiquinone/menaquinone biosynthesis C-methylase UbiE
MDASENITAAFDEIAARYDNAKTSFTAPVAARVADLADLSPGENVLDAGTGTGEVAIRAATRVAPDGHVTGIDLSARMLERAAAEAGRQGVSHLVTFRPGDAARPHAPAGSFDVVLSSLMLYLLPDPAQALTTWRGQLAPGGRLVFSYSLRQDPRWLPVLGAAEKHNPKPGFLSYTGRLPQAAGMRAMLAKLGYQRPVITAETLTTVYHDPQQFWDQSLGQGPWVAWRHIPPGLLGQAKDDVLRLLEPMREDDGTLIRRTRIAYATACQLPARRDTGTHII